jgi:hypothetical protein
MIPVRLCRHALTLCGAAAMLVGCGARNPYPDPTGSSGVMPQIPRSSMLPQAKAGALLYVSNYRNGTVNVYTYPEGSQVDTLTGFAKPLGECADAAGDVFIANSADRDIVEYAHGGSEPIATLNDSVYYPNGCSVDPTTGNLAVSNGQSKKRDGSGSIAIYPHAQGKPKYYTGVQYYNSCGYDDDGNLFVAGVGNSDYVLAELPKGGTTFNNIRPRNFLAVDLIQWDGRYLTDEVPLAHSSWIYRLKVSGSNARAIGITKLDEAGASFIERPRVILAGSSGVDFFNYPSGKGPTKKISDSEGPTGIVVSTASR